MWHLFLYNKPKCMDLLKTKINSPVVDFFGRKSTQKKEKSSCLEDKWGWMGEDLWNTCMPLTLKGIHCQRGSVCIHCHVGLFAANWQLAHCPSTLNGCCNSVEFMANVILVLEEEVKPGEMKWLDSLMVRSARIPASIYLGAVFGAIVPPDVNPVPRSTSLS